VLDLARRATDAELLDVGVPDEEARRSLADLRLVNRALGGRSTLARAVMPFLVGLSRARALDVGCGSADVPAYLCERLPGLLAVGLDIKLLHLRESPRSVARVAADVRRLPFAPASFDVVTASLFLHHFDSGEAPALLASLYALARRALVINDLRRARVPYLFGRAVFPLLFSSRVSVEDGLLSIRRGFREAELRALFAEAGIRGVQVRRAFPYRLVAIAAKP
jgi:SAM-dependent methyltransferase